MPIQKVTSGIIADGAIVATDIADGTVTGPKLGPTSINANNIVNATITGAKLAANTVTGDKIGQNAVSSNNIIASVTLTTPQLSGNLVSSTNSSIRFVSTNSYDGQQNSKIQWINENQNGVMAQISGIREQNAGAPGALGFYTNSNVDSGGYTPTERMRVISSGGVRFACENFANQPSSTNWGIELNNTSGSSVFFGQGTGTETHINFGNRNGIRGSIQTTSGGTSYNTTSDYRLKENIAPMTGALAKISQLNPVTYNWKIGGNGQGFIAHELQEVVPEAVTGEKDAIDENGEPKYQMVDTSFLVATLTAAIQELKTELDAAKQRITELENANK